MSNPMLATTNSNLDIRVKEPSGVVPPPSGVGPGSPDRFRLIKLDTILTLTLKHQVKLVRKLNS